MDWIVGENFNRKAPLDLHGKTIWFPVKIFPNKPIHWHMVSYGFPMVFLWFSHGFPVSNPLIPRKWEHEYGHSRQRAPAFMRADKFVTDPAPECRTWGRVLRVGAPPVEVPSGKLT